KDQQQRAMRMLRHLLLESQQFKDRVTFWRGQDLATRYWMEEDHHAKLFRYLARYPEYYYYESHLMSDGYETDISHVDPPPPVSIPIYFDCVVVRFIPLLFEIIGVLVEQGLADLLHEVLQEYGSLMHYHQTPLMCVHELLLYYFEAPTMRKLTVL